VVEEQGGLARDAGGDRDEGIEEPEARLVGDGDRETSMATTACPIVTRTGRARSMLHCRRTGAARA
jgi:hypothetical protein